MEVVEINGSYGVKEGGPDPGGADSILFDIKLWNGGRSTIIELWSLILPYFGGTRVSGSYGILLRKGIVGAFPIKPFQYKFTTQSYGDQSTAGPCFGYQCYQ